MDTPGDHEYEELLESLLERCLAVPSSERERELDRLCVEHVQYADELRARMRLLRRSGMMTRAVDAKIAAGAALGDAEWFGKFRVIRKLGHGGMGVVWLADQPSMRRQVALKVIRADYLDRPRARDRFRREVEAVSSLDHPGICTVYEAGEVEGTPFIAMRYLKGETLAQRLACHREVAIDVHAGASSSATGTGAPSGESEIFRTVCMIEMVARALHAAHEAGLIHRDVKPGNIMLTEGDEPVLLDFGLAQQEERTGESLTMTGDALGTPAYMSPEQVSSNGRSVDRRTDVYSLGVTLFECLAQRLPFVAPTREELYRQILDSDPPDIRRLNRVVPRDLRIVLATAIAREPVQRYATALDFAEDLRRVRTLEPIAARRPSPPERIWRWARRKPLAAALAVVLVLGVPTVSLLVGYLLAKSSSITIGEEELRHRELESQLARGFGFFREFQPELARAAFEEILRSNPDNIPALDGLVKALVDMGDYASAIRRIELADQTENSVQRLLAWTVLDSGDVDRGFEMVRKVPEAVEPAGLLIHCGRRLQNALNGVHSDLAVAYDLAVRAILASGKPNIQPYLLMIQSAIELGDPKRLRDSIAPVQLLFPDDPTATYLVLRALAELDPKVALSEAKDFRLRWPENTDGLAVLATIYGKLGRFEEAISTLREFLDSGMPRPRHFAEMADYQLETGRVQRAEEYVRKAVQRWPRAWLARVGLARFLRGQERLDAAREEYEAVVAQPGNRCSVLREFGAVLTELGDLDGAARHLQLARRLDDASADVHRFLGRLWIARKRPGEALESLRRSLQLDSESDTADEVRRLIAMIEARK